MEDGTLTIKYDGGDADNHSIDMRLLGESLIGIEKISSTLLIAVTSKRLPKKGERAPLVVKAYEPRPGTVTIPIAYQEAAGMLQLEWSILGPNCNEIVGNWFKSALYLYAGKTSEAEKAMQLVAEMALAQSKLSEKVEDHRHEEMMGMQTLLKEALGRLGPAAVQTVAPIGPSVRRLWMFAGRDRRLTVEQDDADLIRAKADLEWTSLEPWILQTDGFVFHTRRLIVENPDKPGWLNAEVNDPIADIEANVYAAAAQRKARIRVTGKGGYRAGELERLVINEFVGEIDQAA